MAAYRVNDEEALWLQVLDWLDRSPEQEPDWTDGYLAVLSGRATSAKVWTYDREFRNVSRRPDGTRIPLAVS